MRIRRLMGGTLVFFVLAMFGGSVTRAEQDSAPPVRVTILHTNDLHSHFRPDQKAPYLGGVARLKTAIDQLRRENPNTLLVDGGDWSEGEIYYAPGGGAETLRMMEHLGYDVTVVGNHDWLNGPDVLLDAYRQASPSISLVGANLDLGRYVRREEFRQIIPPYVIREVGGVKIAFIGLCTYEFIYDRFFEPVKVTAPFEVTRSLARELKKSVDAVVVISHNGVKMNRRILEVARDVDLVVGAHDHRKLVQPEVVNRIGASDAWVVEAGEYGHFLGKVELEVTPRVARRFRPDTDSAVRLADYRLIQMDQTIREDRATLQRLERLERLIEAHFGERMFNEHVAHNHAHTDNYSAENLMGNLVTDSYLDFSQQADFSLEHMRFIYGSLPKGSLTRADFFNALSAVYDPRTQQSWTLKTFLLKGSTVRWLLGALYSTKVFLKNDERPTPSVAASGIEFSVSPWFGSPMASHYDLSQYFNTMAGSAAGAAGVSPVGDILIGGKPLDPGRRYRVAASNGILYTIDFINSMLPNTIRIEDVRDSGLERWQVLSDYVRARSPLTVEDIPVGNRMRTKKADLGLFADDIDWTPLQTRSSRVRAELNILVRNFGDRPSPLTGPVVRVFGARNPLRLTEETDWMELALPKPLMRMKRGESQTVRFDVELAGRFRLYPLKVVIDRVDDEDNHSNNVITHYLER